MNLATKHQTLQLRTSEVIHRCPLTQPWPFFCPWIFDDWFDEHSKKLGPIKIVSSYHSCRCFFLRRFSTLESRWMGKFDTMRLSYIAKATSVQNVIRVTWRRGPFWLGTSQFADYVKDQTMVLWQSLFNKHRTYPETIQGVPSLNPKRMVKWLVAWVSFQERMKKNPARKTPDQDANIFFSKQNTQFLYIKCPV